MIYKVSYVVRGGSFPGSIRNEEKKPEIGDNVQIGPRQFRIVEVQEMMPTRDNFQFLHAVVTSIEQPEAEEPYW